MELCSRGSLYHVLKEDKTIALTWYFIVFPANLYFFRDRFFSFSFDILYGIKTLHSWNPQILHRDIKTLNYLVNKDYVVKVCDFGLSRFNTSQNMQTMNKIVGTVNYLAPEVYTGETYTEKSDVYSLSIVLWEIIARWLNKRYCSPYEEFGFRFDWQILVAISQNNQRPTFPEKTPEKLKKAVQQAM